METFELFSMKGKNVLITGGRQMYGLGATQALADAGANLYVASHSIESAQSFVDQLRAEKGVKVQAVAFDQSDIGSIERMVEFVVADAGSLDCFVHCSRILPVPTSPAAAGTAGTTPWNPMYTPTPPLPCTCCSWWVSR